MFSRYQSVVEKECENEENIMGRFRAQNAKRLNAKLAKLRTAEASIFAGTAQPRCSIHSLIRSRPQPLKGL